MFRKLFLSIVVAVGFAGSAYANADRTVEPTGPRIRAVVDISDQRIQIYESGVLLHKWKVSTGRRGYITPVGRYKPYRIHKMWRSRKYDNAPMPYSVFFHKGWAVHGTDAIRRLGRPASHGCVRLAPKNAKKLYTLVREFGMDDVEIVVQP